MDCQWPKWVEDGPQALGGNCSLNVSFNFPPGAEQNVDFITVGTTTAAPTPTNTSETTTPGAQSTAGTPDAKMWALVMLVGCIFSLAAAQFDITETESGPFVKPLHAGTLGGDPGGHPGGSPSEPLGGPRRGPPVASFFR